MGNLVEDDFSPTLFKDTGILNSQSDDAELTRAAESQRCSCPHVAVDGASPPFIDPLPHVDHDFTLSPMYADSKMSPAVQQNPVNAASIPYIASSDSHATAAGITFTKGTKKSHTPSAEDVELECIYLSAAHTFPDACTAKYLLDRLGIEQLSLSAIPGSDIADSERPKTPLWMLVALAIASSRYKLLTLQGICAAIEDSFSFFRKAAANTFGMKKSTQYRETIRHLLSLYSIFHRVKRPLCSTGGEYWRVEVSDASEPMMRVRKKHRAQAELRLSASKPRPPFRFDPSSLVQRKPNAKTKRLAKPAPYARKGQKPAGEPQSSVLDDDDIDELDSDDFELEP
ncbi:Forkhead box d1 [Mycena kentingensis (nom. inval.)]|nr:Forkhead box d1 [Mycena kentingensis (nom. inval.)]